MDVDDASTHVGTGKKAPTCDDEEWSLVVENLPLVESMASRLSVTGRAASGRRGDFIDADRGDLFGVGVLALHDAARCWLAGRTKHKRFNLVAGQRIQDAMMGLRNRTVCGVGLPVWLVRARASLAKHFPMGFASLPLEEIKAKVNFNGTRDQAIRDGLEMVVRRRSRFEAAIREHHHDEPTEDDGHGITNGLLKKNKVAGLLSVITDQEREIIRDAFGIDGPMLSDAEIAEKIGANPKSIAGKRDRAIKKMATLKPIEIETKGDD